MTMYVALLRGVNVGGNNAVSMPTLRAACEDLGFANVQSYIQSGNLVFGSDTSAGSIAGQLEDLVLASFGLNIAVVVRSAAGLADVVARNPYRDEATANGSRVFVQFFAEPPPAPQVAKLDPTNSPGEGFTLDGRELYLNLPDGAGKSKLIIHVGAKLGKLGTARNWNTVLKLLALTRSVAEPTC